MSAVLRPQHIAPNSSPRAFADAFARRFFAVPQTLAAQMRLHVHRPFGHAGRVDIAAGGPRGVQETVFHQGEDAMSIRGVFSAALVLGALVAWPSSALRAETEQDREACTPDVHRLCGEYIPDRDAIIGCLKQKKKQLSPACRTVMSRPYKGG
jgi:hypothetical protein